MEERRTPRSARRRVQIILERYGYAFVSFTARTVRLSDPPVVVRVAWPTDIKPETRQAIVADIRQAGIGIAA